MKKKMEKKKQLTGHALVICQQSGNVFGWNISMRNDTNRIVISEGINQENQGQTSVCVCVCVWVCQPTERKKGKQNARL